MKITQEYSFTPEEIAIIKERIADRITEAEASRKLKVNRQTVNDYIARYVRQVAKDSLSSGAVC